MTNHVTAELNGLAQDSAKQKHFFLFFDPDNFILDHTMTFL